VRNCSFLQFPAHGAFLYSAIKDGRSIGQQNQPLGEPMEIFDELTFAITKAALIIAASVGIVVFLAWFGTKSDFPKSGISRFDSFAGAARNVLRRRLFS
jgi:hypothetical protein